MIRLSCLVVQYVEDMLFSTMFLKYLCVATWDAVPNQLWVARRASILSPGTPGSPGSAGMDHGHGPQCLRAGRCPISDS